MFCIRSKMELRQGFICSSSLLVSSESRICRLFIENPAAKTLSKFHPTNDFASLQQFVLCGALHLRPLVNPAASDKVPRSRALGGFFGIVHPPLSRGSVVVGNKCLT